MGASSATSFNRALEERKKCKIYLTGGAQGKFTCMVFYRKRTVADSSEETAEARSSSGFDLDNYRVLGVENCKKIQDLSLAGLCTMYYIGILYYIRLYLSIS